MDTIKFNSKEVKVIAHRGLCGIEKENTYPAFVAAANRSYFGIETDVHVTRDGEFVIIHDETTERVSGGRYNINVEENDYSVIKDIVLPDLNGEIHRQDIRIPLLKDYIQICKKYDKVCVLEVKNHFSVSDLEKMVEVIRKTEYIENVIFISFDFENCLNLRKLLPENDIQWLTDTKDITDELIKKLVENKLDIDIFFNSLTLEGVQLLHSNGIKINCWTCDHKDEAEKMVELGVDFITTDILE